MCFEHGNCRKTNDLNFNYRTYRKIAPFKKNKDCFLSETTNRVISFFCVSASLQKASHLYMCPSPVSDFGLFAFQDVYKDVRTRSPNPPIWQKRKWLALAGAAEHFSKCCFDPAPSLFRFLSSCNNTPAPPRWERVLLSLGLFIKDAFSFSKLAEITPPLLFDLPCDLTR